MRSFFPALAAALACLLLVGCQVRKPVVIEYYDPTQYSRTEDGGVTYPGALQGIDVSSHQGEIDWEQVRAAGIDFAILQVGFRGFGSGSLNADSSFERNYEGAKAAGLKVGVYFYAQAISLKEAEEEADFVCSVLAGRSLDLPVYYDWEEYKDGRTAGKTGMVLTDYAEAFCKRVEAEGYRAGIYFNRSYGDSHFDLDRLQQYSFWLSEPGSYQSYNRKVNVWQYTGTGRVDGVETVVDRDLMYEEETATE